MPVHDEVVLSLSAMDSVLAVDTVASTVTCEAGVVLEARAHRLCTTTATVYSVLCKSYSLHRAGKVSACASLSESL